MVRTYVNRAYPISVQFTYGNPKILKRDALRVRAVYWHASNNRILDTRDILTLSFVYQCLPVCCRLSDAGNLAEYGAFCDQYTETDWTAITDANVSCYSL